jgi:hypothetical protein
MSLFSLTAESIDRHTNFYCAWMCVKMKLLLLTGIHVSHSVCQQWEESYNESVLRFLVHMVMRMKMAVLCDVAPCSLVDIG